MSYLVLARKYRPQTFAEIVGQEHVTRTLANAFAKGRVHHAFLFCGARGVGKTTAARVLAKALCCDEGPTAEPCGTCQPCTTITNGTAVDYFEIDGASNNGVDDVRELRDGVRYQPAQLRRKIYVIDEVHMLTTAAFNALLKTLEEPPPHVTFIFATTEVHKIPITILSRCQRYDFKLVPTRRLEAHLEQVLGSEKIPVEKGALSLLAREAGGSVRDSLSLTDQVIAYAGGETITEARVAEVLGVADRALLTRILRAVIEHDPQTVLESIDAAVGRGVDLSHLARTFLGALRDLAVVQSVRNPADLVEASADEIAELRALGQMVARTQVMALFDRFARACEDMKESQTPRLLVEVALVDMASSEPLVPISELVERVDALSRGAPTATSTSPSRPTSTRTANANTNANANANAPRAPQPAAPPPASPPPAPAPKASYSAPADPFAAWDRLVAILEKRQPGLAMAFLNVRLIGWSDKTIELGTSGPSSLIDADRLKELKAFLSSELGAAIDVKTRTESASAPPSPAAKSVVEVEDQRRTETKQIREDEARKHPLTEKVLETFGASIKEIKVDG
jgi:DNA polymerase-3 subunit gamma/tau